jgi:para-nitrobenzyl esterase
VTALGAPVAVTTAGRVRGVDRDGILAFRAVPYGAPTGPTRFQPPQPVPGWTGIRDATRYRARCPQADAPRGALWGFLGLPLPDDEDCLHVNIWTPGLRDGGLRPVMVWLHGGAYSVGSGSSEVTDGTRLARRGDVVVVAVTHRLNAFGHLYLGELVDELPDSGNSGLLDIVQALEWVRDNIAEFGGDPGNVTIFGQSGGGGKVSALLTSRRAEGLFHRAVVQSSSTAIGARSAARATDDAEQLLDAIGLAPHRAGELADLPMERIRDALAALRVEWRPVLDERTLSEEPFYPDAAPWSADIPLLIGTVKDECRLHLDAADPAWAWFSWDDLPARLGPLLNRDPAETIAFYRKRFPSVSPSELLFRSFTFWNWRYAAVWQAERALDRGGAPVYLYRVDWESPVDDGAWRAPHGIDLPLVFGTLDAPIVGGAQGSATAILEQMSTAWIAFARTGRPGEGPRSWPPYDRERRPMRIFDATPRIEWDDEADERRHAAVHGAPRPPI